MSTDMVESFDHEIEDVLSLINSAKKRIRVQGKSVSNYGLIRPTDGLSGVKKDIWEHRPVSPSRFINSPEFLNYPSSKQVWDSVREDMDIIFSGPDINGDDCYFPACNVFIDCEGIGSGKSTKISIFTCYMIYLLHCLRDPLGYLGVIDTSILFMNVAPVEDKAKKIVFQKTLSMIHRIKWFAETGYLPERRVTSNLKFYKAPSMSNMTMRELQEQDELEKKGIAQRMPVILVAPGSGKISAPTGADLYFGTIDEACSDDGFESIENGDRCEDIFLNMNERRVSRFVEDGMIAMISSAGEEDRFMEQRLLEIEEHRALYGIPDSEKIIRFKTNKVYAVRRAAYESNPKMKVYFDTGQTFKFDVERETDSGAVISKTLEIPEYFREQFEVNPESALKNVCAIPGVSGRRYISQWHLVIRSINKDRPDPLPDNGREEPMEPLDAIKLLPDDFRGIPGQLYYCHIDHGTGGTKGSGRDACGIGIGHEGAPRMKGDTKLPTVFVDLLARFKSSQRNITTENGVMKKKYGELEFSHVREFIFHLADQRGFNFAKITFDGFDSRDSIQILQNKGYLAERKGCTTESWDTMKTIVYDNRINWFYDEHALWEMKRLVVNSKGKIDHSPTSSNDEIECLARVCELIIEDEKPEVIKPRSKRPLRARSTMASGGRPGSPTGRKFFGQMTAQSLYKNASKRNK